MSDSKFARSLTLAGVILALGLGSLSCRDTGYRDEVTSTGEGSTQIQRVPEDKPPPASPAMQTPADPDLAEIQNEWPHLSPADRQTVEALVRRLAGN